MSINPIALSYQNCHLCHRHCGVNRTLRTGYCGMPDTLYAAKAALHFWEEPCISGECGSGAVFFSGCSLRCAYCQNHDIALGLSGKAIDASRLAEIFLSLQEKGAANINLVTPTHYIPSILSAIEQARRQGMRLPIVYNTGCYETLDALKALEGYVDIYLPDFKYWSSEISARYSACPDYSLHARENIAEMFRQVGKASFQKQDSTQEKAAPQEQDSLLARGLIVRHLVLPGLTADSRQIIRYLHQTYGDSIYLSIMSQFTPLSAYLSAFPELNRKVTAKEYDKLIDYAIQLGVENAYIQEGETAGESFIPAFDNEGI